MTTSVTAMDGPAVTITAGEIRWDARSISSLDLASAEDLLVDALVALDAYRLLVQHAIHALHAAQAEIARLERARDRLLEEYRTLRRQMVGSEGS